MPPNRGGIDGSERSCVRRAAGAVAASISRRGLALDAGAVSGKKQDPDTYRRLSGKGCVN